MPHELNSTNHDGLFRTQPSSVRETFQMITESIAASGPMKVEHGATFNRIPAFDFTKGALILFMVLYHWLNYFYGPQGKIYNYLRFLTPSFIFITGFLISHVHFSKYGAASSKLAKRLFLRGLKLLAVFVGLNLIVSLSVSDSFVRNIFSVRSTLSSLDTIFFTARISSGGAGKIAAFGTLVPISYLLMLAALLSLVCRFFKYTFHAVGALSLLCMVVVGLHGIQSTNLELLTIGLFGVVVGYVSGDEIQKLVSRPWVIVVPYCVYLVAITIWDVSLYVQMVGACLTTALIYVAGVQKGRTGRLRGHLVRLGRYSLFGYISQIAILQLLHAGLGHIDLGYATLGASLVAAFALTMISVEAIDRGRAISKTIDGAYRVVFA
jgi:peptidoglycan/LPS O-acetylase OafA/YrhL